MKQTVNFNMFCDAFANMGREDNFTYEGKHVLFDYLQDLENCNAPYYQEIELDVIAICCEYAESTIEELESNYNFDFSGYPEHAKKEAVLNILSEHTSVCGETSNTFIYQQF